MDTVKTQGFTLLEVMVAVAIMGLIMTLLWSSSSQSLKAKDRIENRDMVFHSGGLALRKLSEELSMAFLARSSSSVPSTRPPGPSPAEPSIGTGVPEEMKTFFIGIDEGDADNIRFTSFSHLRLFKDAKESDQCKVSYEIIASKTNEGGRDLVRREEAWLDGSTEVKTSPLVLVEGIGAFNIEYYDIRKGEWGKTWDTEKQDWQGRLPLAVRISLTFADPNDEENSIPLSTAITIPLWRGPVEF